MPPIKEYQSPSRYRSTSTKTPREVTKTTNSLLVRVQTSLGRLHPKRQRTCSVQAVIGFEFLGHYPDKRSREPAEGMADPSRRTQVVQTTRQLSWPSILSTTDFHPGFRLALGLQDHPHRRIKHSSCDTLHYRIVLMGEGWIFEVW